jgi:hypothetical protein
MLLIASALIPLAFPSPHFLEAFVGIIAAIFALIAAVVFYLTRGSSSPDFWPYSLFFLPIVASIGAYCGSYLYNSALPRYFILSLGWSLIPATLFVWLMTKYREHRRGALAFAYISLALSGLLYVHQSIQAIPMGGGNGQSLVFAVLRTIEIMLAFLSLVWAALFSLIIALTFTGFFVVVFTPKGGTRRRAERAVWTVNLTIVLPALVVLILTLALWQAIVVTLFHLPHIADVFKQTRYCAISVPGYMHATDAKYALEEIVKYQSRFLSRDVLLLTLSGIITIWALAPAVACDIHLRTKYSSETCENRASQWLGITLSHAFPAMRVAGEIIRWFVVITTTLFFAGFGKFGETEFSRPLQVILGATLLALIASHGPMRFLALGFRTVLDVALDVINWLRLHPLDSNPRARISARYVSLLRHLSNWRSPEDGRGYDALLIVAHSQGTVVTADLLRFLKAGHAKGVDNGIARFLGDSDSVPIYFFTMGCPLRQLYNVRFPHLYRWVTQDDASHEKMPDPVELNVKLWVNAYRSGDYVGRFLWQTSSSGSLWLKGNESLFEAANRREFCIGPGGHTHYWGINGRDIALELDRLIESLAKAQGAMPKL